MALSGTGQAPRLVASEGACELRAFGLSPTGLSLVVATSCELVFFARQGDAPDA